MEEDEDLVAGYGDFERVNVGIGVGNIIAGKNLRLQRLIQAQELTPQQKFLQAVEYFAITKEVEFNRNLFEEIAKRHPHPEYLNAEVSIFAAKYLLDLSGGTVRLKPWNERTIGEKLDEASINHLDAYRYANMFANYWT